MSRLETGVFPIANLSDLQARYRLYCIRGLSADQDEYDHNVQILIGKLSRSLRTPVTIIALENQPHLAVPEDAPEPPSPFQLVRTTAHFQSTGKTLSLDYENPTPDTERICVRFLQFAIEGSLYNNPRFWQPSAGHPFFEREPIHGKDGVNIYRGYVVRVVRVDAVGFGVSVDVTYKYVAEFPLPPDVAREDFRRYKGTRCVYHFGLGWYEFRLHDHTGLSVKDVMIPETSGAAVSLHGYIMQNARKPLPKDVAELSPDSSAVRYLTARGEIRHAAAALCYPVYDTSDVRIQRLHGDTILAPQKRRPLIQAFVRSYLREIRTAKMTVRILPSAVTYAKNLMLPPDLAFGNGTVLSVRGTPGAIGVSLNQLGRERLSALYNPDVGTYAKKPLDQQCLILPQSAMDSYGPAFINDLRQEIHALYPQEIPYDPVVISYNDRVAKTFAAQGKAILEAIEEAALKPGFGIVMIHETERRIRQHDQLAAMLMHKLRKRQLYVSIIHTAVARDSYRLVQDAKGASTYQQVRERRGRLNGYLRNVAINKVLLLNERWPFVLATPLNADLTVAIDVQNNTACFTSMDKSGSDIRTDITTSREKEKLGKAHVKKVVLKILREDVLLGMKPIQNIVVQRDGTLFTSEIKGVNEAIETLQKEDLLSPLATVNFIEIHKKSASSFRVFDVDDQPGGRESVQNPQVGSPVILNSKDAYICSTGREFNHRGTSKPLHIRYVDGGMPFKLLLEDIYAQTCLALTRPEDCSRLPFTLRLTDIRLTEHAGRYDEDALSFGEDEDDAEPAPDGDEPGARNG